MRAAVCGTCLTINCFPTLFFYNPESTLDAIPSAQANEMCADLGLVDKYIKDGVTKQHANTMDKHWSRWDAFCLAHHVDSYLSTWAYPVPLLQVFGERYRDGRLSPCHKPVKARAVEDGLRAVGQAYARLGAADPRKDVHGGIYFWIQHQIKAYKKDDALPKRVKPVPIVIIIIFIVAQSFGDTRSEEKMAIADSRYDHYRFFLSPPPWRVHWYGIGRRRL
jgi:hypothetical protein